MLMLGIETSCDETAAAVVAADRRILSNRVLSQVDEHAPYGGVVPEIAARSHLAHLDGLIDAALREAGIGFADLAGVAATGGPGLIGGVMVGAVTGKAIALARDLPFIAVNHLEGHALTARLAEDIAFPFLLLLVSGGHCQVLCVRGVGRYRLYGATVDDAVGEAFDKTAKLLGLGYPGGPAVERAARDGVAGAVALPRPMLGKPGCGFSFSGLKTAVRQTVDEAGGRDPQTVANIAHAFQESVAAVLVDRAGNAMARFVAEEGPATSLVVAGGVAANQRLRAALNEAARDAGFAFHAPPAHLCTDNAAMIAWAGIERLRLGLVDGLDFAPRPRWPLDGDHPVRKGARATGGVA